jgi:hypothetical protein
VNFLALQRMSSRALLAVSAVISSLILGSCGGGGAGTTPEFQGGNLNLQPSGGTFYAGVAYQFQINGGLRPYTVSSSEPVTFPVPTTVNGNTFMVIPNNPAVIDTGLGPEDLPGRTVQVVVRDRLGTTFTSATTNGIFVARNFLTGYGVFFTQVGAPDVTCDEAAQACAGGDSIIQMQAAIHGLLQSNRSYRFEVIRGNYQFVVPESPSNPTATLANSVTVVSDHQGIALARIRVPASAQTQLATLRVIDVATGVYTDHVFVIQRGEVEGTLTALPNSFTFTGPREGICGTGTGDFLVFDGTTPYTAVSSSPHVTVTPTSTSANPGRFTISANNSSVCVDNATIVITDALGRRTTVTVDTAEGTEQLPPLAVSPTTVNLADTCGFSASVSVVGGVGGFSTNSTHPRVVANVSGNTLTISRLPSGDGAQVFPTTATISVTDGATIQNVTVNGVAANCP